MIEADHQRMTEFVVQELVRRNVSFMYTKWPSFLVKGTAYIVKTERLKNIMLDDVIEEIVELFESHYDNGKIPVLHAMEEWTFIESKTIITGVGPDEIKIPMYAIRYATVLMEGIDKRTPTRGM